MDRLALLGAVSFSLVIAVNGGMATSQVAARKGHNPKLGTFLGMLAGFVGGMVPALVALTVSDRGGLAVLASLAGGIGLLALVWEALPARDTDAGTLPTGDALKRNIEARHIRGTIMRTLTMVSIAVALVALLILISTIVNKTVGLTAVQYAVEPEDLTIEGEPVNRPLDDLSADELGSVLADNARVTRLRVFILEEVVKADQDQWATLSPQPVSEVLKKHDYPADLAETPLNKLDEAQAAAILTANLDRAHLERLVFDEIVNPEVVDSWTLLESLTTRDDIEEVTASDHPQANLQWRSWVNWDFLSSALDPRSADVTGIRPALYGSLMIIAITILVAFPIGVGAAIYLEEYAAENRLNQIIQTNISNLAGVPSIIYGMLGLAIFVRTLEHVTSGQAFGADTANGRTILSAGFTLALLILPLIIINAQEAIRAVPNSLRQASYGLGATQWQTIWHHVLPAAMPGILTGTILAISRAIGETAPLILVGGATYLTRDPEGPFSIFTALPLVIYRWTTLPQDEFRNAAAAAIVVLLVLLLTLNSFAIILRNRYSRRLS